MQAKERSSDIGIIKALFRGYSDSWFRGVDNGLQFIVEHNYPSDPPVTAAQCKENAFPDGVPPDYNEEVVIDEQSIERDDGWRVPGAQWGDIVPEGRIYIVKAVVTQRSRDTGPAESTEERHATIVEGQGYFFIGCT